MGQRDLSRQTLLGRMTQKPAWKRKTKRISQPEEFLGHWNISHLIEIELNHWKFFNYSMCFLATSSRIFWQQINFPQVKQLSSDKQGSKVQKIPRFFASFRLSFTTTFIWILCNKITSLALSSGNLLFIFCYKLWISVFMFSQLW